MPHQPKPIPDHIFGDLDLPQNGVPYLLARFKGVHHHYRKHPSYPDPGSVVTLFATTSDDQPYQDLTLVYTTDDWHTRHQLTFTKTDLTWDTLRWGWLQTWALELPPQPEGTLLRYKIRASVAGKKGWTYAENQASSFEQATHYTLWYATNHPPTWAQEAVIYQVFVDRFNPGEGTPWLQTDNLMAPMGGTLRGVTEKLEYIRAMGFNTIWLTPIFASPSHHGYDTSDYLQINPRFGTLADFDRLVEKAHALQMRIILDFVANHCSDQHPAFVDALADPSSSYHDWFTWQPWPRYKCFYHVKHMPELDLRYGKPARQYLLGVGQYWLKRGVDGFRLDYAHGTEQDFWVDFQHACRQVNPQCWTFGEIVQPADRQASFAGGIDGSLDFLLCQALRLTFAQQSWSLSRLVGFLQTHQAYYPAGFSLPSFIDNHDMNRFLFSAHEDLRLVIMALQLLYFLHGSPVVYYGTEAPLSQHKSIHQGGALGFDEVRLPMPWQDQDHFSLGSFLQQLAELRRDWRLGESLPLTVLQVDDKTESLVLQRGRLLLALNRAGAPRSIQFTWDQLSLKDICTAEVFTADTGLMKLTLEPLSARFLTGNDPD